MFVEQCYHFNDEGEDERDALKGNGYRGTYSEKHCNEVNGRANHQPTEE
jgi:hypothetical protein